ncbi:unnamed protein product [Phytophthora lilii]|uniref:Unnamed protein product n=1 Tax=Phytophthora lilii TaxID=2077276 RepID=A0A9W6TU58_9STRA|nr:unnamed protein product [Phytophthora lilii]
MTGCRDSLTNIAPCADHSVTMADGRVVVGTEAGDLRVTDGPYGVLHDVVYIPTLAHTLVSVSTLSKNGYKCDFAGDHCTVYSPSIISGHVHEGVYIAPVCGHGLSALSRSSPIVAKDSLEDWHRCDEVPHRIFGTSCRPPGTTLGKVRGYDWLIPPDYWHATAQTSS